MQQFIETAYDMASALVDANTMNHIDFDRCMDDNTEDVCRLKYWRLPKFNKASNNYMDLTNIEIDQLSPLNYMPSAKSCKKAPEDQTCISAPLNESLPFRTFGLTPEDPIILDSRADFMLASVVAESARALAGDSSSTPRLY